MILDFDNMYNIDFFFLPWNINCKYISINNSLMWEKFVCEKKKKAAVDINMLHRKKNVKGCN